MLETWRVKLMTRCVTHRTVIVQPLVERMPKLKIVMEHITTSEAVAFVTAAPSNVAATITPQHLLYTRNAIFQVIGR